MHDEHYDSKWYIDNNCSRHISRSKSQIREFQSLKDAGKVKYENNATGEIKVYIVITNGEFTIQKVGYIQGLQHNMISISQLGIGTRLKMYFDD